MSEVRLGDQIQQEVTVFFSDIRDYTSLAEEMTPEENFRFVNAYAGRMGPVIQKHNGFVNQYLGDGIMAIFQQEPEGALKASIEMQTQIRFYNEERIKQKRRPLQIGMGLHTGSLIMGIIGDQYRTDAATISDSVNIASRMEGLTKYFGTDIIISQQVVDQLPKGNTFHLRYLGLVKVKAENNL